MRDKRVGSDLCSPDCSQEETLYTVYIYFLISCVSFDTSPPLKDIVRLILHKKSRLYEMRIKMQHRKMFTAKSNSVAAENTRADCSQKIHLYLLFISDCAKALKLNSIFIKCIQL